MKTGNPISPLTSASHLRASIRPLAKLERFGSNEPPQIASSVFTLRAAGRDDMPFLKELYRAIRLDELLMLPWKLADKHAFIDQQFDLQHRSYRLTSPQAEFFVIESKASPVGRLYIDRSSDAWHILDISILPSHQSRGIATALLTGMQLTSKSAVKLLLHVAQNNLPAMRLYQRLGFTRGGDTPTHFRMEWVAGGGGVVDVPDGHQL